MTIQQKFILAAGAALLTLGSLGLYSYSAEGRRTRSSSSELGEDRVRAAARLREADEYLRQNSRQAARQALVIFNRVLSLKLSREINQQARYGLGLSLEKLNDKSAALEHYRRLKSEGPYNDHLADRVDYSLGKVLLQINHEAEGRSLLLNLLRKTQDRRMKSRIHTAFGNYYLRRGNRSRARENYTIALKYHPDNLQAELGRADAIRGTGKSRVAYDYYDDYLKGNSNLDPRRRRGTVAKLRGDFYANGVRAYRSKRYGRAIYFFRKSLASAPSARVQEKALYWLAESYHALGQTDKAYRSFGRVLRNTDTGMDQPALIKRGIILFQRGKLKEAAALFQRAESNYTHPVYTKKAREWRLEADAQIREDSDLNRIEDKDKDPAKSTGENPPADNGGGKSGDEPADDKKTSGGDNSGDDVPENTKDRTAADDFE